MYRNTIANPIALTDQLTNFQKLERLVCHIKVDKYPRPTCSHRSFTTSSKKGNLYERCLANHVTIFTRH
jgi:hypothetical protein